MKVSASTLDEIAHEMVAAQIEFPMSVAICAWCKPVKAGTGSGVLTHGICPRHFRKMRIELMKRAVAAK
jgi:hypothetical protein